MNNAQIAFEAFFKSLYGDGPYFYDELCDEQHAAWQAAVDAVLAAQDAREQNNSPVVDQEARAIIVTLQNEIADLRRRLTAAEAFTKPIGDAKVSLQRTADNVGQTIDLGSRIIKTAGKRKGYW